MKRTMLRLGGFGAVLSLCGVALAVTFVPVTQTNLVVNRVGADVPTAAHVDPLLQNPWGIVTTAQGFVFVADNGTSVWTVYDTSGNQRAVIQIPGANGGDAAPTGLVRNFDLDAFVIHQGTKRGASLFMSSSEDGTVAGWNPAVDPTHAFVILDNSGTGPTPAPGVISPAVYKGLAVLQGDEHEHEHQSMRKCNHEEDDDTRLFLTNFADHGQVEVYDEDLHFLFAFTDDNPPPLPQPRVDVPPAGSFFAPFNVANIDGRIFVSFAVKTAPDEGDEFHCTGCGFVDEFDKNGHFERRLQSNDTLNAPWAMIRAPQSFGPFAGQLLVGSFGNGKISAYSFASFQFLGRLSGPQTLCTDNNVGHQFCVDGLWGLAPGRTPNTVGSLFFAAGINDEADGLMGKLTPN